MSELLGLGFMSKKDIEMADFDQCISHPTQIIADFDYPEHMGKYTLAKITNGRADWYQKLNGVGMAGYLFERLDTWLMSPIVNTSVYDYIENPKLLDCPDIYKGNQEVREQLLAQKELMKYKIAIAAFLESVFQFNPVTAMKSALDPTADNIRRNDSLPAKIAIASLVASHPEYKVLLEDVTHDSLPPGDYTVEQREVTDSEGNVHKIAFKVPRKDKTIGESIGDHIFNYTELRSTMDNQQAAVVVNDISCNMINVTTNTPGGSDGKLTEEEMDKVIEDHIYTESPTLNETKYLMTRTAALYRSIPSSGLMYQYQAYLTSNYDAINALTHDIYSGHFIYPDALLSVLSSYDTKEEAEAAVKELTNPNNVYILKTGVGHNLEPYEAREKSTIRDDSKNQEINSIMKQLEDGQRKFNEMAATKSVVPNHSASITPGAKKYEVTSASDIGKESVGNDTASSDFITQYKKVTSKLEEKEAMPIELIHADPIMSANTASTKFATDLYKHNEKVFEDNWQEESPVVPKEREVPDVDGQVLSVIDLSSTKTDPNAPLSEFHKVV